jgi:hypothetical protein
MNTIDIHREGLRWGFEMLEMVMADVTPELAHATPPGIANPLAAIYAHAIADLDAIPNFLLQGKPIMFETEWKDRTGISEPQWFSDFEWARRVTVDLPRAHEYAKAMYENADAYLDSLTESDLAREVDLSFAGLGTRTLSWCLTALVISHLNNMAGEISVLKGIQGIKGYPF